MLVLGLDFETTGLNPKEDRITEVGLCLWHTIRRRPVYQEDFLVNPLVTVPKETWELISSITSITEGDVSEYGLLPTEALDRITRLTDQADAIVAHNGTEFDKLFLGTWHDRLGIPQQHKLWVDTRLDLPEPLTGQLICIAAKHGFLNPFPHQALSDVLTMMRILDGYDLDKVVERARIPNIMVEFIGPFASKDKAKENGFYWNGYKEVNPTKQWLKKIKLCDFDKENEAARPYRIKEAL